MNENRGDWREWSNYVLAEMKRQGALADEQASMLARVDKTLDRNTASLEEHMKRTSLLESELRPIKAHVEFVNSAAKFVTILFGAAGAVATAAKTLGLF